MNEAKKDPGGKPGGSNAGKYKTKGPYCGPSGGAPKGSYPVNTRKRAIAALSYARHAPNPSGIRRCVCRHWPSLPACKKKDSEWEIDTISALDELKAVYSDGMLSEVGLVSELYDLIVIDNASVTDEQLTSIAGKVIEGEVDSALDEMKTFLGVEKHESEPLSE